MPVAKPFVTLVSGLPRSGTSLLMQMLDGGGIPLLSDGVRGPDEDNPRGYHELEAVKASGRDVAWLRRADGRAVKVIHALVRHLPPDREYRVLVACRPIAEVMRSQSSMLARQGRAEGDPDPAGLGALLEAQLRDSLAWLEAEACFRVQRVEYPVLIRQPLETARAIDAFLGGGLDVAAMAAAVDPALYRQRGERAG